MDDRMTRRHVEPFSGGMGAQLHAGLAGRAGEAPGEARAGTVEVESSGDIEVRCRQRPAALGGSLQLVFQAHDDPTPPFCVKVRAPSGKIILERVLRELPTGAPQSAAPLEILAVVGGDYRVEIKQLYGSGRGEAVLRVRF